MTAGARQARCCIPGRAGVTTGFTVAVAVVEAGMLLLALTLVVCAPGYPGNSAEAQPAMDALARALTRATGAPVQAVYEETAEGGLRRLAAADAALLLAPLPFFLDHEAGQSLTARLMAVPRGSAPLQRWTLVAGKERAQALDGFAVQSTAGFSKRFVHAMAKPLERAQVIDSAAVLSGLRRAAGGEPLAVLLDGAQEKALATLPFAARLLPLFASAPVPVALVATVGKRLDDRRRKAVEAALLSLAGDPAAREALEGVQMSGFVALDSAALSAARAAYQQAR